MEDTEIEQGVQTNWQEIMGQLFEQIATLFEELPDFDVHPDSLADFASRHDKGRGWLEIVGSEPPAPSLQELLALLRRSQDWRQPVDPRSERPLPHYVIADDPQCPKPESFKHEAQWRGDVWNVPAEPDHSGYSIIRLYRQNIYVPDKRDEGQFVNNPWGVDLELFYHSGGTFGKTKMPPCLTIHNHVNGQRAVFKPKSS